MARFDGGARVARRFDHRPEAIPNFATLGRRRSDDRRRIDDLRSNSNAGRQMVFTFALGPKGDGVGDQGAPGAGPHNGGIFGSAEPLPKWISITLLLRLGLHSARLHSGTVQKMYCSFIFCRQILRKILFLLNRFLLSKLYFLKD